MANDPYREEREAKWRSALVGHASVLDLLAYRLLDAAEEPDCVQAKKIADEVAHLVRATARLLEEQSVDNPPRRTDD
jgi:hypothetical protein